MFRYFYACIKCGNRPDYESGTKVTFTATPAKGWKFVRWQGSGSGSTSPLQLTVNGELNVVGVFEKDYDPSYYNLHAQVDLKSGKGQYKIELFQLKYSSRTSGGYKDVNLPETGQYITPGKVTEFTSLRQELNDEYYHVLVSFSINQDKSSFNITKGSVVLSNKITGEILSTSGSFTPTDRVGTNLKQILVMTSFLYKDLRDKKIQDLQMNIVME